MPVFLKQCCLVRNMIEEALDNFGDSLETNQKVAVLAETLEKLLQ